jgi:16S rRNA (uracil1498-N3)-methyltransferase
MSRCHRFYIPDSTKYIKFDICDKGIVHQCTSVLRLWVGDSIHVFNGTDPIDHIYQIDKIDKKSIWLSWIWELQREWASKNVHILQSYPNKLSKMELIVQKCSEIWVQKIVFFRSEYSQSPDFLSKSKIDRLHKIATQSAEQSNRASIIWLDFEKTLNFDTIASAQSICFHTDPNIDLTLKDIAPNWDSNICLLIGPEWWFSEKETILFKEKNVTFVSLWTSIFRTETVAMLTSFYLLQQS